MKRFLAALTGLTLMVFLSVSPCLADDPKVVAVEVQGNQDVVSAYILGAAKTKAGEVLDRDQLQKDIESIYNLGFFAMTDASVEPEGDGVKVIFRVQENPKVKEVRFTGNTVYKEEDLQKLLFTVPGSVFNRVFFRNDLQRVREKYQKDGYVMARVEDVSVDNGIVTVKIVEPRIGEIFIQGNKRTKTYVIERELKVKKGDLFNANVLRHSLNKIQGMGFLEDVNVGFEPNEDPNLTNLVLTVTEGKSANITFDLGYGSSSGWSGGIGYEETNFRGMGQRLAVGFETGDREQYYVSLKEPYMDEKNYAWQIGAYKRSWDDLVKYDPTGVETVVYDEDKTGFFAGLGKKFKNNKNLSWYITAEWKDISIDPVSGDFDPAYLKSKLLDGVSFTLTGTLTRDQRNEYLSYPNGDVEILGIEQALEFLGGEWNYTKYWVEARYYKPIDIFNNIFDFKFSNEDVPVIFAARAVGDNWYGEDYLFGKNTQCYKAIEILKFTSNAEYIYGYTIKLFPQPDGNLEKIEIDIEDF